MQKLFIVCIVFFSAVLFGRMPLRNLTQRPKLIVLVVFDQFRADYLTRFHSKFVQAKDKNGRLGGFKYLLENGAWFAQSHFHILQNMTGPGHATLLTGAYPYMTGVPINEWYDSAKKDSVYCTEDPDNVWFSSPSAKHVGTSPKNLLGTTVGDEIRNTAPKSQVVSISIKDRSAILMGGHRATVALWMDPQRFQWTSTQFYFPDGKLPDWVLSLNTELKNTDATPTQASKIVNPLLARASSLFPKALAWGDKSILASPSGLQMTETLAEKAVGNLKLGRGAGTDLLAVSFSSHDYAGHTYGPASPAMEEMTLHDDLVLAKLLNYLNTELPNGMKDVVLVLTADHGVAPNPELTENSKIDAGRVDEELLLAKAEKKLEEHFGNVEGGWLLKVKELNFYLNPKAFEIKKVDKELVESFLKDLLLKEKGIAHAFTYSDYKKRQLPPGIFQEQILNSYFPGRSGDVVAVLKPYYISGDETANHQTGYSYDSHVPLIFAGRSIYPGVYATPAEPTDIAATLSFLIGTVPPSGSHGRVLAEIFDGK